MIRQAMHRIRYLNDTAIDDHPGCLGRSTGGRNLAIMKQQASHSTDQPAVDMDLCISARVMDHSCDYGSSLGVVARASTGLIGDGLLT